MLIDGLELNGNFKKNNSNFQDWTEITGRLILNFSLLLGGWKEGECRTFSCIGHIQNANRGWPPDKLPPQTILYRDRF